MNDLQLAQLTTSTSVGSSYTSSIDMLELINLAINQDIRNPCLALVFHVVCGE